ASGNGVGFNQIAGNSGDGVVLDGAGTASNSVQNNGIGVDASGRAALANRGHGVTMSGGATGNTIGGAFGTTGNLISGNVVGGINRIHRNRGDGVVLDGAGTASNSVQNNPIGVNASGRAALANQGYGVTVSGGATGNTIGGAYGPQAGTGNVISGNATGGIL